MPVIELVTSIAAPRERVFDLARSIELHLHSTARTGERAIAGVKTGLIGLGESVTWRARHFCVWQTLSVTIAEFARPLHFTDTMIKGTFRRMEHRHVFDAVREGTMMRDYFDFCSPLGWLGRMADALIITRHLRRLLVERNECIRAAAESEGWRKFLPG